MPGCRADLPTSACGYAASHPYPSRGDLEVQPCAFTLRNATQRKPRGNVRLVGRLVVAESRVAVDTEQRDLRFGDQLGCERTEIASESFEECDHRCTHMLLYFSFRGWNHSRRLFRFNARRNDSVLGVNGDVTFRILPVDG